MTIGKTRTELTELASAALRAQPGCATAAVGEVQALQESGGRNWQIPNVVLGDSLISDVDRAVISIHRRLGREYHLIRED